MRGLAMEIPFNRPQLAGDEHAYIDDALAGESFRGMASSRADVPIRWSVD